MALCISRCVVFAMSEGDVRLVMSLKISTKECLWGYTKDVIHLAVEVR